MPPGAVQEANTTYKTSLLGSMFGGMSGLLAPDPDIVDDSVLSDIKNKKEERCASGTRSA